MLRPVLAVRILSRMAPKPRPVPNLSDTIAHSTFKKQSRSASHTSDSEELEILGIKTWTGKATFVNPDAARRVSKPGSSVNDLANQLIDLTVSPSPCKATHEINRPRGVAHFASPSARTAFSPTKNPVRREVPNRPIHPFFKQSIQERKTGLGTQEQTRGVITFRNTSQAKHDASAHNPFQSPPISPTLSAASVASSPIQPPPASQRPRLAPPSSSSSCGSLSSIASTFDSASTRSRSPSPSKPTAPSPLPAQKSRYASSSPSPLRVISPSVNRKPPSPGQKSFKPAFNPVPNRSTPPAKQAVESVAKHPSGQSPWKWTKWGWTQQRQPSPSRYPVVQVKPVKASSGRKGTSSTIDPLIMSMQNLGLEKGSAPGTTSPNEAESQPSAPQPSLNSPATKLTPPPAAPLRKFSHKTYHIGNPLFTKPPTLAYTADLGEANELLSMIKGDAIAFDMEWPFSRGRGGGAGKTALVQVGDDRLVVLVHLSMMKVFPAKLREILEDPNIYKLGVNVIGDGQKLVRDYGDIYTRGILDLSDIARAVDSANCKPGSSKIALAKLCEQYIGCELDKGAVRTSNWSKRLSQAQMDYAADDVYSTTMIYNSLMFLAKQRGITVDRSSLSIDLSPEVYSAPSVVLQDATGVKTNSTKPNGRSAVPMVKGIAPSKMRAFSFFNMGKSVDEIGKAMRTEDNPLLPNTVRGYLLDVVTSDVPLEYDKQRMYDILSEDVHPANAQKNKAFLSKLVKQLGKQIPRSPPAAKPSNLVSSDVESSQEVRQRL